MRRVITLFNSFLGLAIFAGMMMLNTLFSKAAGDASLTSRYITYSPDGTAFTIGLGVKPKTMYSMSDYGKTVVSLGLFEQEELKEGYHEYRSLFVGQVPIAYWTLSHPLAQCVHSDPTFNRKISALDQIGVSLTNCGRRYSAGWIPTCAICHETAARLFFYSEKEILENICYIPSGTRESNYFYLCPYDNSIEMHASTNHICKKQSPNRYRIKYCSDDKDSYGYMTDDFFYYENSETYEGEKVDLKTELSPCELLRDGYVFEGWRIGDGNNPRTVRDREEWLTVQSILSSSELENEAVIKLYAIWKEAPLQEEGNDETGSLELEAEIVRLLKAIDGKDSFTPGESGDLNIILKGEADTLCITFPDYMSEYNAEYSYDGDGKAEHSEAIRFIVPFRGIPEGVNELVVIVTAKKGEQIVEKYPFCIIDFSNGSILNELRTSLR